MKAQPCGRIFCERFLSHPRIPQCGLESYTYGFPLTGPGIGGGGGVGYSWAAAKLMTKHNNQLTTMNKQITRILAVAAITGLVSLTWAADQLDQAEFPQISAQPTDQAVPLGGRTALTVEAANSDAYQWLRNGAVLQGQTNCNLILENVGIDDVGYYSCAVIKGVELVPTREASLNVYTLEDDGGPITVYGWPVVSNGSQGTCPGAYAGYVSYTKTVSQGWGWAPDTNTTTHTASDQNRADTKVQYVGKYGDVDCNQTTVTIPHPTSSPKYRFSIYFTNNVPTNSYAITLTGFDP
jgi:hypothetical protein